MAKNRLKSSGGESSIVRIPALDKILESGWRPPGISEEAKAQICLYYKRVPVADLCAALKLTRAQVQSYAGRAGLQRRAYP